MPSGIDLSQTQAVLFDVDGTLVDSLPMLIRGLGDTFERYVGFRPADAEIQAMIGMPLRVQLTRYHTKPVKESELAEMIAYTIDRYDAHEHLERLFAPAVETLRILHLAGIRTALVTSKNAEELRRFLLRFPGADDVDTTVCASDVTNPKPHPESAELACAKLNVQADRCVLIGDSIYDMQCGRRAGLKCVAVSYGSGLREELLAQQPDLLLETPEALLEWATDSLAETTCPERRS
ncbi:MAG TPA: HAD-IA family hydrolase [Fimbriimonadaceae bacterium]|nr:HAD-IA family hydrolase [Fimbriimonadaceae bacterium]